MLDDIMYNLDEHCKNSFLPGEISTLFQHRLTFLGQ